MLKEFTEGRDALRGAFKELMATAWLSKVQPREKGKFDSNLYRIHSTADWKTVDGETADGKPATSNTDRSKTEKRKRPQSLEAYLGRDLVCPLDWRAWPVQELKWPESRVGLVWAMFCDHWKAVPGPKALKTDWEATWRNWFRREVSFAKPSKTGDLKFR